MKVKEKKKTCRDGEAFCKEWRGRNRQEPRFVTLRGKFSFDTFSAEELNDKLNFTKDEKPP